MGDRTNANQIYTRLLSEIKVNWNWNIPNTNITVNVINYQLCQFLHVVYMYMYV